MGTSFMSLLLTFKFAPTAKVSKLLKSGTATDSELALAVKSTKEYKENKELQKEVAIIIANSKEAVIEKKAEPVQIPTSRGGEPRRW